MKRFVPLYFLFLVACGKEASVVPAMSIAPAPTAQVTYEPTTSPSAVPTELPTVSPTPTPIPTATAPATATPLPRATATPAPTGSVATTHANTPTDAPPDAYLRDHSREDKGEATSYNWQTTPSKRTAYTDQTPDPATEMTVSQGDNMTIKFTRSDTPSQVGARYRTDPGLNAHSTAVPIANGNPASLQANFPKGTIWLDVFSYWPQGDVEHTFKLNVV